MTGEAAFFLPDALVLDVAEVDDQHRALFAKLAELKLVCVAENYFPAARAEELLDTLQQHFATEERLANAVGYDFSGHAKKHEIMLSAIRKGVAKVNDGTKDVFGLLRYVEYWFERHIAEEDKPLGDFIAGGGPLNS